MYNIGQIIYLVMINPGKRPYAGFYKVTRNSRDLLSMKNNINVEITVSVPSGETLSTGSYGEPIRVCVVQEGQNPNGSSFRNQTEAYFYEVFGGVLLIDIN